MKFAQISVVMITHLISIFPQTTKYNIVVLKLLHNTERHGSLRGKAAKQKQVHSHIVGECVHWFNLHEEQFVYLIKITNAHILQPRKLTYRYTNICTKAHTHKTFITALLWVIAEVRKKPKCPP